MPDGYNEDEKLDRLTAMLRHLTERMDELEARLRERARPTVRDDSQTFYPWRRTQLRSPPRRLH
jgi:hypothetical protein